MLFPFTFTISMPNIINPFSKSPDLSNVITSSHTPVTPNGHQEKRWLPERRPHPSSLPPPVPLARKRGWQPSSPEPSLAAADKTSTSGYINMQPKYREFTVTPEAREEEEGTGEMTAARHFSANRGCIIKCTCLVYTMPFAHGLHVHAVHALHSPI
ncbi:hypothetical protein B0F90DRAFT_953015 [Multifurca ochricompacta]|uniref:Uncharacterized protein n=1 Tax=Multifurca ochricompacta TaxID=376703 RepID=A0AAD4M9M3_9AGAM|nr:hypothetical protein B0F90DRAFT_953015 [Multifurca ochricompacta]